VSRRTRVLVLARSYPNPVIPLLGLWSRRLVHCVDQVVEAKVVSPVPWAPPLGRTRRFAEFTRFREVPHAAWDGPVEVLYPRMLIGPGHTTYPLESASYAVAAARAVAGLRRSFPFDLIHAHFTYPDGVAACLLGRRYGVPVVITDHVPWQFQRSRLVRRQGAWAARTCDAVLPVSEYVRRTMAEELGIEAAEPVPLVLDDAMLATPPPVERDPSQLLFVGVIRQVKGFDVLVEALRLLRDRRPGVRLVVAGDPFYRTYRREFEDMMARARALGVEDAIETTGGVPPAEVARLMAASAAVVLPSRCESFGSVIIEALACGTPVVATRCGAPEELVTEEVGRLVPPEDPRALADALAAVLDEPRRYEPAALRRHALARYGRDAVGRQLARAYSAVLGRPVGGENPPSTDPSSLQTGAGAPGVISRA
jgi:glycosyltransferase involved in cell wall biosynthesis